MGLVVALSILETSCVSTSVPAQQKYWRIGCLKEGLNHACEVLEYFLTLNAVISF